MEAGAALRVGLALALLTPVLAGCGSRTSLEEDDRRTLESWRAEQVPADQRGLQASLDLEGSPVATGNLTADRLEAPVEIAPAPTFPDQHRFAFFTNATVDGSPPGLLVLEGSNLTAESGTLEGLTLERIEAEDPVELSPRTHQAGVSGEEYAFPEEWASAGDALFFTERVLVGLDGVQVADFSRGLWIHGNDTTEIQPPVSFSAESLLWDANGTLSTDEVELAVEEVGIAGGLEGTADPEERGAFEDPEAVFGHGGQVQIQGDQLATSQPVRLTQVIQDEGPQLSAEVQLQPTSESVQVQAGETAWLGVLYRERSNVGDALLENATVTGPASSMVELPVQRPPTFVETLWDAVEEAGAPAVPFAIPLGAASPLLLAAEALGCIALGCPENFPYPTWIDAGDVGRFFLKVEADAEPGSYPATVEIDGQNYAPKQLDVTVEVVG